MALNLEQMALCATAVHRERILLSLSAAAWLEAAVSEISGLRAESERRRIGIMEYGTHAPDCCWHKSMQASPPRDDCDCGFNDLVNLPEQEGGG